MSNLTEYEIHRILFTQRGADKYKKLDDKNTENMEIDIQQAVKIFLATIDPGDVFGMTEHYEPTNSSWEWCIIHYRTKKEKM